MWHHSLAQYFPRIIIDVLAVRHGASVLHAVNGALRRAKLELAGCHGISTLEAVANCRGLTALDVSACDEGRQ